MAAGWLVIQEQLRRERENQERQEESARKQREFEAANKCPACGQTIYPMSGTSTCWVGPAWELSTTGRR